MVDIYPDYDAHTSQSAPTTSYDLAYLSAGGTSYLRTFMQFPIPANPVGEQIATASLRLRVGTGGGNESAYEHTVSAMQGTVSDWSTLTHNNRPTTVDAVLGTFTPSTLGAEYNITLDAAEVRNWVGGNLIIEVYHGNGTDSSTFRSLEYTTEAERPMLTLTYETTGTPGAATYGLTITHTTDLATVASRTYEIDATGSTGTTSLAWDGASRGTITESPTGTYTFTDPDDGATALALTLTAAGTGGQSDDTVGIVIARGGTAQPSALTCYDGAGNQVITNWG